MAPRNLTPKDFASHVLAVIAELSGHTPGTVVPMEHTYEPVCERMGVTAEDFGTAPGKGALLRVHRQIQLAMRQLRDNGLTDYPSRGQWTLTHQGLEALKRGDAAALPAEDGLPLVHVAARTAAATAEGTRSTQDTVPDNVVQISIPRHPYSDDPYIRGLAIQRVSCFGAFSSRSDVCKGCGLQSDCLAAAGTRKAEIAAEMLREEEEARREEEARLAKKARHDAGVDELIASTEREGGASQKGSRTGPKGRFKPRPGQEVADALPQRESECTQCGGVVREGEPCAWLEHEGVFHKECIEEQA